MQIQGFSTLAEFISYVDRHTVAFGTLPPGILLTVKEEEMLRKSLAEIVFKQVGAKLEVPKESRLTELYGVPIQLIRV